MINLLTGDDLRAVATNNTAVTYTVTGLELTTAPLETYKRLAGPAQLTNAITTIIPTIAAATQVFIKTIHLQSTSGSSQTVSFYINGSVAANLLKTLVIPANGSAIFNQEGWTVYDSAGLILYTSPTILTGDVTGSGAGTIPTTIANDAVTTPKILNDAVTYAKIQNVTTDRLLGRDTAGSGDVEELTATGGVEFTGGPGIQTSAFTGDVTKAAGGTAQTIATNVVDNTKLTDMAQSTIKGRAVGAGTGDPQDLTSAQATAILDTATTLLKGLQSASDKLKEDNIWFDVTADFGVNNLDKTGATDNTAKINNILTAVAAGSVLYWPAGTYNTTGGHSVTKTLIILGQGRSITVINMTNATNTIFTLTAGAAGTGFEQIRISATNAALRTAGFAVDFANAANAYMQQCDILFQWSGVHSSGGLQFLDDMNIREQGANAANGAAILIDSTGDRYLRRVTTDNPTDPTGFAAVRVRECSSLVITDCNLINGTNTLDIVPNAGAGHQVASILSVNTFYDSSVIGCNIVPATNNDSVNRVRFINCWFSTMTTAGVVLGSASINTANVNSVSFIGCDFYQNPFGIDSLGVAEWDVRSSRFSGNTNTAIRVAQGLQAGVQGFTISDNFIGNGAGFGANGLGINIQTGTYNRYQILDNRGLESNTTPGITDIGVVAVTGQKNVKNNMGALLAGQSQLSNSGGAAVITGRGAVTSGVGETLLVNARIPANAMTVGQTFRVSLYGQSSSTGTLQFRIRSGAAGTIADTQIWIPTISAAQAANAYAMMDALVTVTALGGTSTVAAAGHVIAQAAVLGTVTGAEVVANVPNTAAWFIDVTCACTIGTFTVRHVAIEAL